jgi:hypothetical protein
MQSPKHPDLDIRRLNFDTWISNSLPDTSLKDRLSRINPPALHSIALQCNGFVAVNGKQFEDRKLSCIKWERCGPSRLALLKDSNNNTLIIRESRSS